MEGSTQQPSLTVSLLPATITAWPFCVKGPGEASIQLVKTPSPTHSLHLEDSEHIFPTSFPQVVTSLVPSPQSTIHEQGQEDPHLSLWPIPLIPH